MTVTHDKREDSTFQMDDHQINFPGFGDKDVTLAHYSTIDILAVAVDNAQIAELDLEEFKKFARKVLADELAEPLAPDWHDAQVIRGKQLGRTRYFLSDRDGDFLTDSGIAWSPEILANNISDIEIVVGADDE